MVNLNTHVMVGPVTRQRQKQTSMMLIFLWLCESVDTSHVKFHWLKIIKESTLMPLFIVSYHI